MEPTLKQRHLWTREEYDRMIAGGVFDSGARVELIDGEIFEMSPQGSRHSTAVVLAEALLSKCLPGNVHLRIQMPLALDRELKSQLYARSGIPEYWIVNLVDGQLEVRTGPVGDGYADVRVAGGGDIVHCQFAPAFEIAVLDLLP